jgi:hypothetical protein
MLKSYTVEEYRNLYENLPKKIQRLFWEEDVTDRIIKLTERFQLDDRKSKKIIQIVAFIYYGILPPSHIKRVVEVEINLGSDKNEAISNEIIRLLIAPFYVLLKNLYEKDEFEKIGIKSFLDEEKSTKKERNSFGDLYREPIE